MSSSSVSRQQRRRIEREQVKAGRTLIARGLTPRPQRPALRDVAQVMRTILTDADNPQRAGDAAAIAHEVNERALRRFPGATAIACREGCSYCCYSFVGAVPPDIFRAASAVRARRAVGPSIDAIVERAARLRHVGAEARVGARLACPLLENGRCSIYADRPLTCRQATSLSVDACREEFEGNLAGSDRIEVSDAHLSHASNAHVALLGAMRAAGLPTIAYEFSAALATALVTADAEPRWLEGEDIFADIQRIPPRAANVERIVEIIAEDLAG